MQYSLQLLLQAPNNKDFKSTIGVIDLGQNYKIFFTYWYWSFTFPASSRITATTPKNGKHADPGLVGVHPGRGVITWPPVSV